MSTEMLQAHPLASKDFSEFTGWNAFRQAWEDAKTPEDLMNLLHRGFDIVGMPTPEIIRFYLGMADGYYSIGRVFPLVEDDPSKPYAREAEIRTSIIPNDYKGSASRIRALLVRKAWEVLCDRVFKHYMCIVGPDHDEFDDILRFLTPQPGKINLPSRLNGPSGDADTHGNNILKGYALRFIYKTWCDSSNKKCVAARPQTLLMLHVLQEPYELLDLDFCGSRLAGTEADMRAETLKMLRPFALMTDEVSWLKPMGTTWRTPLKNLRDGVRQGWPWANIYLILQERLR